jgi:hypothetical protein
MSVDERQLFSKEVSLFVASITSEIQNLNHEVDRLSENVMYHSIAADENVHGDVDHAESSQVTFYKLILSSLLTVSPRSMMHYFTMARSPLKYNNVILTII